MADRDQRGAAGENTVEIRAGDCVDFVCVRGRRFVCSDESDSEQQ